MNRFSSLLVISAICGTFTPVLPAFAATVAPSADISISSHTGPSKVTRPNQGTVSVSYAITIRNSGPNDAKELRLKVEPATGGIYQNQRFSGCTATDKPNKCVVGLIQANTSKIVTVTYDLPASSSCRGMTIGHLAGVSSTQTKDPNMVNNNVSFTTEITCPVATPPARLDIIVKSTGSMDTAVKNQKNISLLRFEAKASQQSVLMKSLLFTAQTGSLLNAQKYALWVDTDGDSTVDTMLQSNVNATSGSVTFTDLSGGGYVIPSEETVLFEVHADVAANLISSVLQLSFFTNPVYIGAEELATGAALTGTSTNGYCKWPVCDISVTTTSSTIWNLVNGGSLFITKDAESVRSRQLLGGTLGEEILRLNVRADTEDIEVTLVSFVNVGTGSSIDRLDLYKAGEGTPFTVATVAACQSTLQNVFCATLTNSQFVVPSGEQIDVIVRPRIKTDVNGGKSNDQVRLQIAGGVSARGVQTSNDLTANNGNAVAEGEVFIGTPVAGPDAAITGSKNVVVLSKITSIVNANLDADNTRVPTGVRPIGQFRFTAAAHNNTKNGMNKVDLFGVIFTVNATNVDLDGGSFKLYNKADASAKAPCVIVGSQVNSGSLNVRCMNMNTLNGVQTVIDAGQDATFVLEASVTNAQVITSAPSLLQVSINNFADINNPSFGAIGSHLVWFDKDTASSKMFVWMESPETVIHSTKYQN